MEVLNNKRREQGKDTVLDALHTPTHAEHPPTVLFIFYAPLTCLFRGERL